MFFPSAPVRVVALSIVTYSIFLGELRHIAYPYTAYSPGAYGRNRNDRKYEPQ